MEENISRGRFIRLGAALGVGAAGASVLAACGGGESGGSGEGGGGDTGGANGGGSAGGTTEARAITEQTQAEATREEASGGSSGGAAIASESEVAPGSAKPFKDGGEDAVLVRLDGGEFVAYSAVCTHQGCTVAYRDGQLACPCHGSVFDPANGGAVVTPPAEQPLPEIPVEVRGGEVFKA